MARRFECLVLALLLGGCGGDESDEASSASGCAPGEWLSDDGICVAGGPPPDMPCPPGERMREEDGTCIPAGVPPDGCGEGFAHDGDRSCEPILPALPCAKGLMAVPGERSCREVAPCVSGKWGDIVVEPATQYVDASYTGGVSDGSSAAPWTSIQAGIDAAVAGATVAVAAGSYAEDVVIAGKPVRLWGRCPSLVEIKGTGAEAAAIGILAGASGTEVRRLAITGDAVGLILSGSTDVLVEEVWVHDNASRGVNAEDTFGPTSIVVRGSLLEHNQEVGAYFWSSNGTLEATVVRNTEGLLSGRGVSIEHDPASGARTSVLIARSLIEHSIGSGVLVQSSDARLEATVVGDTLPDAQGFFGRGVSAENSAATGEPASVTVARSLIAHSHELGMFISASNATVEATVVRDTLPDASGPDSRGVSVQGDPVTAVRASAYVLHSVLEQNQGTGLAVVGGDATVEATIVRDTLPVAQVLGRAVQVQHLPQTGAPSSATLRTSVFERSVEAAILVVGTATADIDACILRDTVPNDAGLFGDGLVVWSHSGSASAAVNATLIERSERAAVSSFGASIAVGKSLFVCQAIDFAAEIWEDKMAVLEDRGAVLCGCPQATEQCTAKSYALAPPPPL